MTTDTPGDRSDITAEQLLGLIKNFIKEQHPEQQVFQAVTLDSSLDRDLGIESLGRMELLNRLEKQFRVTISEQLIIAAETPRDLLRGVQMGTAGKEKASFSAYNRSESFINPAEEAPHQAATLVEVLAWHLAVHPQHPHIRLYDDDDEGEIITYEELYQGAVTVAAGLQQQGLSSGEAVLIMLPTSREYFYSFMGILLAGGIPVPIYPPGRIKQIEEHLRRHVLLAQNCLARIMITMDEALPFAGFLPHYVDSLKHVVTVGQLHDLSLSHKLLEPGITAANIAFLQYTSGSTGMPKGVVLTHANLLANIRAMGSVIEPTTADVFVSWLPLYHDMGLIGAWFGSLYYGCRLVIMPPLSFIARPERWFSAIHRFRGTLSAAPNFAYELCLRRLTDEQLKDLDLTSWRCAFNGAEAVRPATVERFIDTFGPYGFRPEAMMPVYGLAESSVGLAFPPIGRKPIIDRINRRELMDKSRAVAAQDSDGNALTFVNCGRPLPDHQIRIAEDNGRELPERHEGNIQFQGPSATSGYFRNQEKTRELFHGDWLNSGDKGYMAGGDLYITGRAKDIIIRAGRNIYPEELETAIGGIDGVRQGNVAVFGTLDQESGTERLVVLAESRKKAEDARNRMVELIRSLVVELTGEPPDDIVIAPPNSVLKTSSGKIRRDACRIIYEQDDIGKSPRAVWMQIVRVMAGNLFAQLKQLQRNILANLYAVYSWCLFTGAIPVLFSGTIVLPGKARRLAFLRVCMRYILRLAGIPFRVKGIENLPHQGQPCIYVSNHASYLDGFALVAAIPRLLSFVAKAELKQNVIVRLILEKIGVQFVERFERQKGLADTQQLLEKARQGASLLFFAEGTFARMSGLLPFRMGAFEVAVAGRLPVVPIAIRGSRSVLRADSWFPRRGPIEVTIGKAIAPDDFQSKDEDTWKSALHLKEMVRTWILKHCGEPDLAFERVKIFAAAQKQHGSSQAGDKNNR